MATCSGEALRRGMMSIATLVAVPMMAMLRIVPTPGRSPSGYHAASTGMPTRMLTVPSWSPVSWAMPWWKTSHGPRPMPASAMPRDPHAEQDEAHEEAGEAWEDDGGRPP